MSRRNNVNAFSKDIFKGQILPEELFCNLPKPLNRIDDYVRESDKVCLGLKRDLLKRMQSSPQFTFEKISKDLDKSQKKKHRDIGSDYHLPGMPSELMPVQNKRHKRQKKKIKTIDISKLKTGGEGSSDEDGVKKDVKGSESESEPEKQNDSSSGEEAGDYADTYFDNGEEHLPSDNSEGDGDFY